MSLFEHESIHFYEANVDNLLYFVKERIDSRKNRSNFLQVLLISIFYLLRNSMKSLNKRFFVIRIGNLTLLLFLFEKILISLRSSRLSNIVFPVLHLAFNIKLSFNSTAIIVNFCMIVIDNDVNVTVRLHF